MALHPEDACALTGVALANATLAKVPGEEGQPGGELLVDAKVAAARQLSADASAPAATEARARRLGPETPERCMRGARGGATVGILCLRRMRQ